LKSNDKNQYAAGDVGFLPCQNHPAGNQLTEEIRNHEECADEPSDTPAFHDVFSLFAPLHPHADAIFDECRYQTEASDMG
jgi:hypothetical protein